MDPLRDIAIVLSPALEQRVVQIFCLRRWSRELDRFADELAVRESGTFGEALLRSTSLEMQDHIRFGFEGSTCEEPTLETLFATWCEQVRRHLPQ